MSKTRSEQCPGRMTPVIDICVLLAKRETKLFSLLNAWAEQTPLLGKGGVDAPSRKIPVPMKGADGEAVKKLESSAIPLLASLLHHCKEGWPSDSENIAKHPLIARPGWFSDESKRKTTPAASASVASPNFL